MTSKRKRHSSAFKAKVALEALKEQQSLAQLARQFGILPVQISAWKRQLADGLPGVFESPRSIISEDFDKERTQLHAKIGELTVQLEFLKKSPSSSAFHAISRSRGA